MKTLAALTPLAAILTLTACTPPTDLTGAELFQANCAACHGTDARGGAMLDAPDLTRLTARHGGTFPTAFIMSQIDGFSRDATHGAMPEFGPLLASEMEVWIDDNGVPTPTPGALIRLAEYLEGVQR